MAGETTGMAMAATSVAATLSMASLPLLIIGMGVLAVGESSALEQTEVALTKGAPFLSPGVLLLLPFSAAFSPRGHPTLFAEAFGPDLDFFAGFGKSLEERAGAIVQLIASAPGQSDALVEFSRSLGGRDQPGSPDPSDVRESAGAEREFTHKFAAEQPGLSRERTTPTSGAMGPRSIQTALRTAPNYTHPSYDLPEGPTRVQDGQIIHLSDVVPGHGAAPKSELPAGWRGTADHFDYHGGGEHSRRSNMHEYRDLPERSPNRSFEGSNKA